jgi:hypothetical protein
LEIIIWVRCSTFTITLPTQQPCSVLPKQTLTNKNELVGHLRTKGESMDNKEKELTTEAHLGSLLNGIFWVHYFNPGFLIREREREREFFRYKSCWRRACQILSSVINWLDCCSQICQDKKGEIWGKKNSEILKFSNSNPKNSEGKYWIFKNIVFVEIKKFNWLINYTTNMCLSCQGS